MMSNSLNHLHPELRNPKLDAEPHVGPVVVDNLFLDHQRFHPNPPLQLFILPLPTNVLAMSKEAVGLQDSGCNSCQEESNILPAGNWQWDIPRIVLVVELLNGIAS